MWCGFSFLTPAGSVSVYQCVLSDFHAVKMAVNATTAWWQQNDVFYGTFITRYHDIICLQRPL